MDDEQILMRGGTQEDIDAYAKRNGADLPNQESFADKLVREAVEVLNEKVNDYETGRQVIVRILDNFRNDALNKYEAESQIEKLIVSILETKIRQAVKETKERLTLEEATISVELEDDVELSSLVNGYNNAIEDLEELKETI